jgi:hypothetical protein
MAVSVGAPAAATIAETGQPADTRSEELHRIGGALRQLADALATLGTPVGEGRAIEVDVAFDDTELALVAQSLYQMRRRRADAFPTGLFAEPAWDILLDLFCSTVGGKRISTKSLCCAADVPTSTALRWIGILEEKGMLRRWTPPDDQRLTVVHMTPDGYDRMRTLLSDWLTASQRDARKMKRNIA